MISSSILLHKNKKPRAKLNSASSQSQKAGNAAVAATKLSAIREKWETKQKQLESLAGKKPNHDVYFTKMYAPQRHTIEDIVSWHREFVSEPNMLASPNATLWAQFTLNCRTKKKTRFIHQLPLVFLLPRPLDFIPPKNVLAFCTEVGEIAAALEAGAFDAGGKELISKVERGHYNYESFDYVVCHKDILPSVAKLKTALRDKLPLPKSEQVGTDMAALVKLYKDGVVIDMKKSDALPQVGTMKVMLGTLDWSTEDIKANLETYAQAIHEGGESKVLGNIIEDVEISCPPSDEIFYVKLDCLNQVAVEDSSVTAVEEEEEEETVEPLEDATA